MKDFLLIFLFLLASVAFTFASAWAFSHPEWWAGPLFVWGLILSVAFGVGAFIGTIAALYRGYDAR